MTNFFKFQSFSILVTLSRKLNSVFYKGQVYETLATVFICNNFKAS